MSGALGASRMNLTPEQVASPGFKHHSIGDDPVSQASFDLMTGEVTGLAGTVRTPVRAKLSVQLARKSHESIPNRARRDLEAYRVAARAQASSDHLKTGYPRGAMEPLGSETTKQSRKHLSEEFQSFLKQVEHVRQKNE